MGTVRPVKRAPAAPARRGAGAFQACDCTKWRKLSPEQRDDRVWRVAHTLHHNITGRRGIPFTLERFTEMANTDRAHARAVLDEAVRLSWFNLLPANGGNPAFYISPAKPK